MSVEVRLFAMLRERAGARTVELRLRPGATVGDALRALAEHGALGELLERLPVRLAVNRDYASESTVLSPGDELALIPPVSGGDPTSSTGGEPAGAARVEPAGEARVEPAGVRVRISDQPLSPERLTASVGDPAAGAIVVFQGVTREVPFLDYEAYVEMAGERIEQILRECVAAHGLTGAAAEHRVGRVARGEPSVVVAVSAPHREEAFAGARQAIDRIKHEAPIWKREHDGRTPGSWVEGTTPGTAEGEHG
jgi:molybdopterin synthase catalytic subunit